MDSVEDSPPMKRVKKYAELLPQVRRMENKTFIITHLREDVERLYSIPGHQTPILLVSKRCFKEDIPDMCETQKLVCLHRGSAASGLFVRGSNL